MISTDFKQLKKDVSYYFDKVIKNDDLLFVSTRKGNVVVMTEQVYSNLLDSIYIVSQPTLLEKIKNGEKEDISLMSTYNYQDEW